jgi:hypothetical protein
MQFYRLYSGTDGRSHFERLDSSKTSDFFNTTREANGLLFRNDFAPHIVNFHRAPHRRWVITLSGSVDIGIGDGSRMTFHAGDVFLAEDTTGQGHTAAPHDWVRAYVDLEPAKVRNR